MLKLYPGLLFARIFGPNAADVLQFTNNLSLGGGNPTRIHVMANDDFRLFAHPGDDDLFDDHFPVKTLMYRLYLAVYPWSIPYPLDPIKNKNPLYYTEYC